MKWNGIEVALESAPVKGELSLAQPIALAAGEMRADRAAGIIRNVPVIAVGPAKGHGFEIDRQTLTTLLAAAKQNKNIKCRLTHAERAGKDGALFLVGRPKKLRIAPGGDRVLCDIHVGGYAKSSPTGDLYTYLFDLAENDPSIIGLSIVAGFDFEVVRDEATDRERYLARVLWIRAIDFTDNPAANREGLLTAAEEKAPAPPGGTSRKKEEKMNARQRAFLVSLGMDEKATLKAAKEFALSIGEEDQTRFKALAAAQHDDGGSDGDGDETGLSAGRGDDDDDDDGNGEGETALDADAGGDDDDEPAPKRKVKVLKPRGGEDALSARERRAERQRILDLTALAARHELDEAWLSEAIENETTLQEARNYALDRLAEKRKPLAPRATGGEDGRETALAGLTDALCLQAGAKVEKPHARHDEFVHLPLCQMFNVYLSALGIDTRKLSPERTWSLLTGGPLALYQAGLGERALSHGSSDFPLILANVQNKILLEGYDEEPSTWQEWAAEMEVKDFKEAKLITAGGIPTPPKVLENAEYGFATFGEKQEKISVAKYGVLLQLSWEMFINDDLGAFTGDTFDMGGACRELEGDIVYNVLTSNPTMNEDGLALFHATHNNLNASSSGAPNLTRISAMRAAMRKQRGVASSSGAADGRRMSMAPVVVLTPEVLADSTMQLFGSTVDITKNNATPNYSFVRQLKIVSDPRLDDNSTTAWYAVGPKRKRPIVAAFLRGHRRPRIIREPAKISTDGFIYKVTHVVGAAAGEWRAIQKNNG